MKRKMTIRLDGKLEQMLEVFCRRSQRKRSEVVRDALRRHLSLFLFEQLRRKTVPFAKARGYLADKDVCRVVS
jgi:predicted transcriptional regulator